MMLEPTKENIKAAKDFVFEKWKERAAELEREEPVDLEGACKASSLFVQRVFGGEISGNWHHIHVLKDGKIIDLNSEACDVRRLKELFGEEGVYRADKKFLKRREFKDSMDSWNWRVNKWVEEFMSRRKNASLDPTGEYSVNINMSYMYYVDWAKDPQTPLHALKKLAKHPNSKIREALATNPSLTKQIFQKLAKDEFPKVRANVAKNAATPVEVLKELKDDPDESVLNALVLNKNITAEMLNYIYPFYWDNYYIVLGMATNDSTPKDFLEDIYHKLDRIDQDPFAYPIEAGLAGNKNTSAWIITRLLEYDSPNSVYKGEVLKNLAKRDDLMPPTIRKLVDISLSDFYSNELQEEIIRNPRVGEKVLLRFAVVSNESIQELLEQRLGGNPLELKRIRDKADALIKEAKESSDENRLRELAKEDIFEVLFGLSSNPHTPEDVFIELIDRGIDRLIPNILSNPGASGEVLERVFPNLLPQHYNNILRNPNCTEKIIRDIYDKGRDNYAIALNPNTPEDILVEVVGKLLRHSLKDMLVIRDNIPKKVWLAILRTPHYKDLEEVALQNPSIPPILKNRAVTKVKKRVNLFSKDKPYLNLKDKFNESLPGKANTDLELLKRLKGYLKNV